MPIFTTFSIFLPECPTLTPLLISSEIVLILDKVFFTCSDISVESLFLDLNAVCRTDLFSVSLMKEPLKYLFIFSLRSVSSQSSINKSKAFLLILFLEKSTYKSLKLIVKFSSLSFSLLK